MHENCQMTLLRNLDEKLDQLQVQLYHTYIANPQRGKGAQILLILKGQQPDFIFYNQKNAYFHHPWQCALHTVPQNVIDCVGIFQPLIVLNKIGPPASLVQTSTPAIKSDNKQTFNCCCQLSRSFFFFLLLFIF